jgi:hypothetical protein
LEEIVFKAASYRTAKTQALLKDLLINYREDKRHRRVQKAQGHFDP